MGKRISLAGGAIAAALILMPMCFSFCGDVALVSGYVRDSDTNDGIPWADIDIECMDNYKTAHTQTGSRGSYFASVCCPAGSDVTVKADNGRKAGTGRGTVVFRSVMPETKVNVGATEVGITIPEFASVIIPLIMSIMSVGLAMRK